MVNLLYWMESISKEALLLVLFTGLLNLTSWYSSIDSGCWIEYLSHQNLDVIVIILFVVVLAFMARILSHHTYGEIGNFQ
ncbi:hypothetical protein AAHA92_06923 [Salvia divinorum]|uniref:Uncharacterized protein n=1 Tax=Salvia divinorum TaxID=28513 RepID=A0ABD1I8A1_SALDI